MNYNLQQHYVGQKELYIFTKKEMDLFILSTGSINLSLIEEQDLENFLYKFKRFIKENTILQFKTGDYGLLLFQQLVDKILEKHNAIPLVYDISFYKPVPNSIQYVEYGIQHLKCIIRIVVDNQLNLKQNIDKNTGFPIASETLYFDKIV